jgi:hypothetical protein
VPLRHDKLAEIADEWSFGGLAVERKVKGPKTAEQYEEPARFAKRLKELNRGSYPADVG